MDNEKVEVSIDVKVKALMELNESELRALDALVGYGVQPFLKVFYEKLGKAYLGPHEDGLRSLFANIERTSTEPLRQATNHRYWLREAQKENPTVKLKQSPVQTNEEALMASRLFEELNTKTLRSNLKRWSGGLFKPVPSNKVGIFAGLVIASLAHSIFTVLRHVISAL